MKKLLSIILSITVILFVGCGSNKTVEQKPPPVEKVDSSVKESPPVVEEVAEPVVEKKNVNLGITLEQFKEMSKERATSALVMDQDIKNENSDSSYYNFSEARKDLAEGFLKGEVTLNVEGDIVNLADKINFDSTTIKFDDSEEIFQLEYSFNYGREISKTKQMIRGTIDKSTGMIKEIAMLVKNPEPINLSMSYITLGIWLSVFNPEMTEPQRKEFLFDDLEAYHSIDYLDKSDSRGCNVGVRGNFKYTITVIDKDAIVISVAPKDASPPPKILDLGLTPEQFKERALQSNYLDNVKLTKRASKDDNDIYEGEFTFKGEYQFEKSRPPVSGVKQKFDCLVDSKSGLIIAFVVERERKSETDEFLGKLPCIILSQVFNSELTPENRDAFIIKFDGRNGLGLENPISVTRHAVHGNVRYIVEDYTKIGDWSKNIIKVMVSAKDYGFPASHVSSWWWLTSF